MPKSVHLATPRPTREEMVRHLRIPKARQKELDALARKYWEKLAAEKHTAAGDAIEREVKPKDVSAAD